MKSDKFIVFLKIFILQIVNLLVIFLIFIGNLIIVAVKSIVEVGLILLRLLNKIRKITIRLMIIFPKLLIITLINYYYKFYSKIHNLFYRLLFTRPPKKQKKPKTQKFTPITFASYKTKIKYFILGIFITLIITAIYQGYLFVLSLPNPRLIGNVNYPISSKIYDRNGILLYEIYRDQNRTPIKIEQLPEVVLQATIAIEDSQFYNHQGISFRGGILRAIKDMYETGNLQGGSTITQQLIKTALLTPERTWKRKIKEAILALSAENLYSKKQILEMYLNQIPYGGSAYGIEEASQTYFNKSSKDLNLEEAAFLAGLPQAPSIYSPYVNPSQALRRRNEVLTAMLEQNYINEIAYKNAIEQPLNVIPIKTSIKAPHFVFYVKSILEEKYGIKKVEEGGLRVYTSLDYSLQQQIEKYLSEEIAKINHLNVTNGAVLITLPKTGEILVMLGSVDYFKQPYGAYNTTLAIRQPGSSIKPILYSLALENNYTAASVIADTPVRYQITGASDYVPVNYDGRFHGLVPLRYALANSYNVPAVKVLSTIGTDKFIKHAQKLGISSWNTPQRYGLSLALGGAEVKMVDMAVAYGVFANNGIKVSLNPIIKVEDYQSQNIDNQLIKNEGQPAVSEQIAFIINDILSDNFARRNAFGLVNDLNIKDHQVAVKTGTTNLKKDNWTIGYTPKYLAAVWVGNNDGSPMNPLLTSGVTGASPIWNRIMNYLLDEYDYTIDFNLSVSSQFIKPTGIIQKKCFFGRDEYFIEGTDAINCHDSSLKPNISLSPTLKPN